MRRLVLGLAFLLFSLPAFAGPIYDYEFTVTGTSGPLAGEMSTGSFSYEATQFSERVLGLALTAFDFAWHGIDYGLSEVSFLASAWVDGEGRLDISPGMVSTFFGNNCDIGTCGVNIANETWNMEFGFPDALGFNSIFRYAFPGMDGVQNGTASLTLIDATSVPEPGALGLLGIGLLGLLGLHTRALWQSMTGVFFWLMRERTNEKRWTDSRNIHYRHTDCGDHRSNYLRVC